MKLFSLSLLVAVTMGLSASACAGSSPLPDGPYVVADGSATIEAVPDYATIPFTLTNTAESTSKASPAVQEKTLKIFKLLHDLRIPEKDVTASDVKVHPDYEYEGDKEVYKGQTVERDFIITLHNLDKYTDLMQGLLDVDVDNLRDVEFATTHQNELVKQAMDAAIDDSQTQAEEMTKHAGARLDKVYALASSDYRSYLVEGFPLQPSYAQLGSTSRPGGKSVLFIIQKSIRIKYDVTVVYTITPGE